MVFDVPKCLKLGVRGQYYERGYEEQWVNGGPQGHLGISSRELSLPSFKLKDIAHLFNKITNNFLTDDILCISPQPKYVVCAKTLC